MRVELRIFSNEWKPIMSKEESCCFELAKSLQGLQLCLDSCTRGNAWQRNPYIRSSITKKNLEALHQSVEQVIQNILTFTAQCANQQFNAMQLHAYYKTYIFLFDFNDGIKREEYYHRILIRDEKTLLLFAKLQHESLNMITSMQKIK